MTDTETVLRGLPRGTVIFFHRGVNPAFPVDIVDDTGGRFTQVGTYAIAIHGLPAPEEHQPGRPGQLLELEVWLKQ